MSTYRRRLFVWWEVALDTVILGAAIPMRAWYLFSAFAAAIALRLLSRRSSAELLRIDESGIHLPGIDLGWSNIAAIEGRRPPFTWSDRLLLDRPLVHPKWLSFQRIKRISLERYERDWVNGQIGQDIARWAPHLLEGRVRANA